MLTVHPCIIWFKWSQPSAHYFLAYLFQLLYMFRVTMCPSSGELYLCDTGIFHSVWVAVCSADQQTRQSRIDTVSSPDCGHIVARNMYNSWNECTKKYCAPSRIRLKPSVRNYYHSLRKHPEERSSLLLRVGSPKSFRIFNTFSFCLCRNCRSNAPSNYVHSYFARLGRIPWMFCFASSWL